MSPISFYYPARRIVLEQPASRGWSVCLATLLGATPFTVITAAVASAASSSTPTEVAPASVLYGTPAAVTLTAANTGTAAEYNASFEDVLPAGVAYVTGSSTVSERGIHPGRQRPEDHRQCPGNGTDQPDLVEWRRHPTDRIPEGRDDRRFKGLRAGCLPAWRGARRSKCWRRARLAPR